MSNYSRSGIVSRYWWIPLVTGLVAIGLGIWTLCAPAESLPVLAYAFAICMCIAGVLNVCLSFTPIPNSGWCLALGLLELIAGVWMLVLPAPVLTVTFMFFVGIWIMVAAVNALCESSVMSRYTGGAGIAFMILLLVATIILAVMFLTSPISGGIAVWLWLGISFITFGAYRISLAFAMRRIGTVTGGVF